MSTTRISPRPSPACALVSRTENRIPSLVRAHRQDSRRASTPSNHPPPPIPYTITSFCLSLTHTPFLPCLSSSPPPPRLRPPLPCTRSTSLYPFCTSRCCCCGVLLHAACLPGCILRLAPLLVFGEGWCGWLGKRGWGGGELTDNPQGSVFQTGSSYSGVASRIKSFSPPPTSPHLSSR